MHSIAKSRIRWFTGTRVVDCYLSSLLCCLRCMMPLQETTPPTARIALYACRRTQGLRHKKQRHLSQQNTKKKVSTGVLRGPQYLW